MDGMAVLWEECVSLQHGAFIHIDFVFGCGGGTSSLLEASRRWARESEFAQAAEYAMAALQEAEKASDKTACAQALCQMAALDILTWRDAQAWEHALAAEQLAREVRNDTLLSDALLQKGRVCVFANVDGSTPREEEALGYFREALKLAGKAGNIPLQVDILYNMSQALVNVNRFNNPLDEDIYREAGAVLEKGESLSRENHRPDLLEKALPYRIRYYRQGGRLQEAIDCCEEALSHAADDNYLLRSQILNHLSVLYAQTGRTEQSVRSHQQFANTTQLYMRQKSDFLLQEMETRYASQRKEQQIRQMRLEIWFLVLFALLLAVLLVLSVLMVKRSQRQRAALDAANRGKEGLLRLVSTSFTSPDFGVLARRTMEEITQMDEAEARKHCMALLADAPDELQQEVADYLVTLSARRRNAAKSKGLTAREIDIIRCCREGLSNTQIADRLHISLSTVKNHKQNIFSKLNADSTPQMLSRVESLGIL